MVEMDASGATTAINTFGANGLLSRRTGGVNGTTTFYTFDPQGNVCQRFGSQGAYMSTDMYDAFGMAAHSPSGTTDVFGYGAQAGYYTDSETGYVLLTNRYYDPSRGRFITRDPIGYNGGANLYGYVGNGPLRFGDPLGLVNREQYELGGAVLGGVALDGPVPAALGGLIGGSLYDAADAFGTAVGCYEGGYASFWQVAFAGTIAWGSLGAAALPLAGELGPAASLAEEAPSGGGALTTGYRYVQPWEADFAAANGYVPNVDAQNALKPLFISPTQYSTAAEAEQALQIGSLHPAGPYPSPTHGIEVELRGIRLEYGGNVEGGTGSEVITYRNVPVRRIFKLK